MGRMKTTIPLLLVLVVWGGLAGGISLYVDYLWFNSVGYLDVFETTLWSKFAFWLIGFAISFVVLGSNLWLATRRSLGLYWMSEELMTLARKGITYLFWIAVLVLSGFVGVAVQGRWMTFLQYQHQVPMGVNEPIFEQDISFYFFSLPVLSFLVHFALALVVLSLLVSAVNYVTHGHLAYLERLQLSYAARAHLTLLVVVGFGLLSYRFWLKCYEILYATDGVTFGAGYADIHARLPCYMVLVGVCIVTALAFGLSLFGSTLRMAAFSGIGFGIAYLGLNVYPIVIQTFVVEPNELQRETPFINHNINLTRRAYNLDKIEVHDFPGAGELTPEDLVNNETTIRNIRLWDAKPVKDAYGQLQSIRPYYEFEDVDLDRYVIDGEYRQVMVSVRELDFSKISEQAQTFINQYFTYTHGFGLCMSPVNEVTPEGLPEFFIQDIPPKVSVDLSVTRPEIYFGERTDHPVFVKTKMEEFDYPLGDQNAMTRYEADRGVPIGSFLRRLLFAWELGSLRNILFTENLTEDSRVLMYRNIQERVRNIAPFLEYDSDPYIVLHEGRLFWIQDAYTLTDRYPYSEPYRNSFNYIRNSAKIVVDAYLGDMSFYISDTQDPLIRVYAAIFPTLFKSLDQMPEGLRAHVRYPEGLFNVQRELFSTYHMFDPTVFYNKEDLWEIPNEIYRGNEQPIESYYIIMSLPGSSQEEFILMVPYTPRNKNNMISWLAARSDGEHYGTLVLYQFPKQELRYGPMQIEARIDQDPNISQLITLWSQKGSQVIRGNLLVIPIEDSLLYVEPLYLQAEKSKIPELTRVITVYQNRVSLGETLDEALRAALMAPPARGGADPSYAVETRSFDTQQAPATSRSDDLGVRALQHYQHSQQHLRQGNWAAYGEEQRKLGETLDRLKQQNSNPDGTGP